MPASNALHIFYNADSVYIGGLAMPASNARNIFNNVNSVYVGVGRERHAAAISAHIKRWLLHNVALAHIFCPFSLKVKHYSSE